MSPRRGLAWAVALAGAAVLLTGCGHSNQNLTGYEPGVYKGAKDDLLAAHATPESKARLQERFKTGQTDR